MSLSRICDADSTALIFGGDDGVYLGGSSVKSTGVGIGYCVALIFCLFGHSVLSEIMMYAVEKITSTKKRVFDKATHRRRTTKVWNSTVANLTIIAFGARAPQLMLPTFELFTGEGENGNMGIWTIAGSAAFDLFIGLALCVAAIPDWEIRTIEKLANYVVVVLACIFAYAWLLFVLLVTTPNMITIAEGVVTFLFYPALVYVAFLVDRRCTGPSRKKNRTISSDMTPEELSSLMASVQQKYGQRLSDEEMKAILELEFSAPRSRAQYRLEATRAITGGKQIKSLNTSYQKIQPCMLVHPEDEQPKTDEEIEQSAQDPWLRGHEFYFVVVDKLMDSPADWRLPRFQELVRMDGWLHKQRIDINSVENRTLSGSFAALSHVWQAPDMPDPDGEQVTALKAYLTRNPHIKYVWIDFCCLPQGDNRTDKEQLIFQAGLKSMNLVYLACYVIVMVDNQYLGRFWTQFEAFSAFQEATESGLLASTKSRHDFVFTGLAVDESELITEMLQRRWAKVSVPMAVHKLSKNDVKVTNEGDKEVQLKKLQSLNERVGGLVRSRRLPVYGASVARNGTGTSNNANALDRVIEFDSSYYAVSKSGGRLRVKVKRTGDASRAQQVSFATRDGSAFAGADYQEASGQVTFAEQETEKDCELTIKDNPEFYELEEFYVELLAPRPSCRLGKNSLATVVILDDNKPGILGFEYETSRIEEATETRLLKVNVLRSHGASGKVSCLYSTEDATALAERDYTPCQGILEFEPGQTSASFDVAIFACGRYSSTQEFRVILSDVQGGARFDETTDGGADCCVMTISIMPDLRNKDRVDNVGKLLVTDWDELKMGHASWKEQFAAAVYVGGSEEAQAEASCLQWMLHVVNVPWKLVFALIPPVEFCNGWICFLCSLVFTALLTALTRDLALMGTCHLRIEDSDGFFLIVAVGLSLPNTLAYRASAMAEQYADNSINHVISSISVSVFLGIGVPWLIGACRDGPGPSGALLVSADRLWPTLVAFLAGAVVCIAVLSCRRRIFGGELGGGAHNKRLTALLFSLLWLAFVLTAIITVNLSAAAASAR